MTVYKLEASLHEPIKNVRGLVFLASRLAGWVVRFRTAIRSRRSVKHLLEWDDRMLSDIGLTRGDVFAAVSGPITDDAGQRLSCLASERRFADLAARRGRRPLQRGWKRTS
jgi:uncharacterized protein YjiS (DUF1127 family)